VSAAVATSSGHSTRSRRSKSIIGIGIVAVVAALAIGRFLTAGTNSGEVTASPAVASPEATVSSLEQRVAAYPDDGAAWLALGRADLQEAIRTSDPGYYGRAQQALTTAHRLRPSDETTIVSQGALALSMHDFAGALTLGTTARGLDRFDGDALAVLVDASVELGHYDEAATFLQQLLDLRPNVAALSRASYLRELHGDLPGSEAAMRDAAVAAAATPPQRATIETFLGELALGRGAVDESAAHYDNALRLVPGLVNAEVGRARTLVASGRLTEAITELTATAQRSPQPAVAALLGDLQMLSGHQREADDAFALVRANDELLVANGVVVDLESAIFEADHGQPGAALTYAQKAYAARHTIFTADALAWALYRTSRVSDALPYVEEALGVGSLSAQLHAHAALIYDAAGDASSAARELKVAIAQSPWFTLTLRAEVSALGDRLGIAIPTAWRP
jgi:cytochrome c-type biogenesis protein CcmH/NrfG